MSSEIDKRLIAEFQRKNPGKHAIWRGKVTQQFREWFKSKEEGIEKDNKKNNFKKKPTSAMERLENRINLLEKQVKYLMSKLGGVEVKLANEKDKNTTYSSEKIKIIKKIIKSKVLPGDSMSIDDLTRIKELQKFPIALLEKGINELIDDEIFDASKGYSVKKINGNIGLLIRR